MGKYYLDLSILDRTDPLAAYRLKSDKIMELTGVNIGNLAFRHALRFVLRDTVIYGLADYTRYREATSQGKVSETIVSCANWLGNSDADERNNLFRAHTFEAADGPITCFGLGVQAPHGAKVAELGPNTQRMAHVLSERSALISVRDETTQNTLERYGVTNTVITGCPSNFINGDPGLGRQVANRAADLLTRVQSWNDLRSLICEISGGNTASNAVMTRSLELLDQSPCFYVLQTPALLPWALRESPDIPGNYRDASPFDDPARLTRALNRSIIHFSSVQSWMDFARSCDLSFGMRIHGNMIPLQAGVPSVLISHDSRTAGLASVMGIPRVTAEDFVTTYADRPNAMLEVIVEAMQSYDAHRKTLAKTMLNYVKSNGLDPHPSLTGLAETA